jgi:hypothetical protein
MSALARLDGLHRLADRGVQDRAGRDAGEDALLLDQLRVRRSASRGPTEKRDDRTEPSYSSGTKPSSMLRRP